MIVLDARITEPTNIQTMTENTQKKKETQ